MKPVVEDVISEVDEEEEADVHEATLSNKSEESKSDLKPKRESMRMKYPVDNKRDQKFWAKQQLKNINAARLGRDDIKHRPLD